MMMVSRPWIVAMTVHFSGTLHPLNSLEPGFQNHEEK